MKTKFTSCLFFAFVASLFFNLSMQAQYMCTDIVPDSVVSAAPGATVSYTTDIDVNNDAIMDFRIDFEQLGNFGFVNVQAQQIGTVNAVLANGSNTALALPLGTPITATSATWVQMNNTNQQMSIQAFGPPGGSYPGNGDRYLGLRFVVGANTYYGWARFNFASAVNSYTLKDYGYNATPNASIAAGQVCAAPFVPTFTIASPLCAGNSVTVTANTGTNVVTGYTWAAAPSGPTIASPNASATTISFSTSGTFSITLTAVSGTTGSSTNTILINPKPTFTITTTNTMLCAGQTATITASGANSYTWNPGPVTGSNLVVSPITNTNYSLTGTSAAGCTNSVVFTQSVTTCSGIQQFGSDKQSFSVYPNPANDKLFIAINTFQLLEVNIDVLDLMGKSVIKQTKNYNANDKTLEINITNIPKGIYFVRIISSDQNSQMIKIIKE